MKYESTLTELQLTQLYDLFEQSHNNLNHLFEMGSNLKSFAVKQENRLLNKYANEIKAAFPNTETRTLDLILGCDKMIDSFRQAEEREDSLMIRQEKHLRKQFMKDLKQEFIWFSKKI